MYTCDSILHSTKGVTDLKSIVGKRVKILQETMKAAEDGCYFVEKREVKLPLCFEQIKEVKLYSVEQISQLPRIPRSEKGSARIVLRNQDTLEAALDLHRHKEEWEKPVLVLNFANPRYPGGADPRNPRSGIRANPKTQEEQLCVKTTLLCSLETEKARPFYQANLDCGTQAQTDTILYSPNTVVIRNPGLSLREDPFPIAVMTVSAPKASSMKREKPPVLERILRNRIDGMIRTAIEEGYTRLVLGAWGCGSFGNDPELVAKLFHQALMDPNGSCLGDFFTEIIMAVFDNSTEQVKYQSFARYFPEG
ncbi:MAG: TIGR02452 family protein [Mailhella sp.]